MVANLEASDEENTDEEDEPPRKLTKAERTALNQLRGGQGTQGKKGKAAGRVDTAAASTPPERPQPPMGGAQGGRGKGRGRGRGRGQDFKDYVCKYCGLTGHIARYCQILEKEEHDQIFKNHDTHNHLAFRLFVDLKFNQCLCDDT